MSTKKNKELSAYDVQATHQLFRISLEWLEKYIGVVYPNYQIKKQIHDNVVKRKDANDPNKVKSLLSSSLFGFKVTLEIVGGDEQSKQSLYNEVKTEYYKWLAAAGINPSDCPLELKHFLFEINEILERRADKLEKDIENRKWEIDPDSVEYEEAMEKLFSNLPVALAKEWKKEQSMAGKTYQEIKCSNNFNGKEEVGKQIFQQIAKNHDYQDFHFIPQKTSQDILEEKTSDRFQRRPNALIIRNIKENPKDWKIAEIVTKHDNFGKGKKEMALIHKGAEIDYNGKELGSQPVFLAQRFSQEEKMNINKYLNVPATNADWNSPHEMTENSEESNFVRPQKNNNSLVYFSLIGGTILLVGAMIYSVDKSKKKVSR